MNTTTKTIDPHSAVNQRILSRFVDREVLHCVSALVDHFAKNPVALDDSEYDYDNVLELCQSVDWETAVRDHPSFIEYTDGWVEVQADPGNPEASSVGFEKWQEAAEHLDIDESDAENEVYEHWIVSDFLSRKLAEKGHPTGELFNLTIWGRPTTGQTISMDGVIAEIALEMGILEGQEHSWAE